MNGSGIRPVRIVALGDSTTAGTPGFLSPLEAPPSGSGNEQSQYAWWLNRVRPDWRVLNRGINGERSDEIRKRFARDVLEEAPPLMILIAGVNDIYQGKSTDSVEENLSWIYEEALKNDIAVVAGSILPFNTATPEQIRKMRIVNEWVRKKAESSSSLAWCDTRAAVAEPGNVERLAGSPDGLHPDVEGYRRMAEALQPVIESLLLSP